MFVVNIQEKKERKKKHLDGENHFYHHNASVHKTLTFLKGDFHLSPGLKQYACVCVCVLDVVVVFCPTAANKHTHTPNIRTHTHSNTHTRPLLVEKDMAQWRDTPPLGRCTDHQEETEVVATATRGLPTHRHSG